MKKITLLLVIIFTFLFSTTSWGEWTYVLQNKVLFEINFDGIGIEYYYDKDRLRKSGKYLYFWRLQTFTEPIGGNLSGIRYVQLDCSIFRFKQLNIQMFNKPMGEGEKTLEFTPPDEWKYPPPKSIMGYFYNRICKKHQ